MPLARKTTFEQPYIEVIERLVARRKQIGMSQTDLGALFGEDQSFVSRIERRQRRLDVWEFVRFCRILGVAPGELLDKLADE